MHVLEYHNNRFDLKYHTLIIAIINYYGDPKNSHARHSQRQFQVGGGGGGEGVVSKI